MILEDDVMKKGEIKSEVRMMKNERKIEFKYGSEIEIDGDDKMKELKIKKKEKKYRVEKGRELIERLCRIGVLKIKEE